MLFVQGLSRVWRLLGYKVVFQFLLFLEFELFAHNEREHTLRLQAHVMTPSCIMMKLNSAAKWKLGDTSWPGRHSFRINASMHRCCDSEILVKFAVLVQLRVFRWVQVCISQCSASQIFPDLPRSSQIVPASLNFVVPAMPFFSHAPGIGPGGGLYVSEMTQNGAIEFKKCSSKENGLEPRISTDAVRQCHCAKICQIRSTFFQWNDFVDVCPLLHPSCPFSSLPLSLCEYLVVPGSVCLSLSLHTSLSVLGARRCFKMSVSHVFLWHMSASCVSVHASLCVTHMSAMSVLISDVRPPPYLYEYNLCMYQCICQYAPA
jgi:hypothetical protein